MIIMRSLIVIGAVLAVAVVASALSFLIISTRSSGTMKRLALARARPSFTVAEIREDIEWFSSALTKVHPPTIPEFPLADISGSLRELENSIVTPLSRLEFYRIFAPLVCSLGDEHTSALLPHNEIELYAASGGTFFPLQVTWIDGRLYSKTALPEAGIQPGMEIITIQGQAAAALRDKLMVFFSGTRDEQRLDYLAANFSAALFAGLGMGGPFEVVLRSEGSTGELIVLIPGKVSMAADDERFSYRVLDDRVALMSFRSFQDPERVYVQFLDKMFNDIASRGITSLVIDVRGNKGGATAMGDLLVSYLTDKPFIQFRRMETLVSKEARNRFISEAPAAIRWMPIQYFHPSLAPLWKSRPGEVSKVDFPAINPSRTSNKFTGQLFVIIGPGSMSSSTLLASCARLFLNATLVGEATGGMDTMYGNMAEYTLPNTGLELEIPCSVLYGNTFGPVIPDHHVTQTVADLASGKDTVLETCLSLTSISC